LIPEIDEIPHVPLGNDHPFGLTLDSNIKRHDFALDDVPAGTRKTVLGWMDDVVISARVSGLACVIPHIDIGDACFLGISEIAEQVVCHVELGESACCHLLYGGAVPFSEIQWKVYEFHPIRADFITSKELKGIEVQTYKN
jgi:hypothetical protein